jgi:nudix motif 8
MYRKLLFKMNMSTLKIDQTFLQSLRTALVDHVPRKRYKSNGATREAAVLIPLCMVDRKLSILFTVRSSKLREHCGEVAFPGGMMDLNDNGIVDTALRETFEEILIPKDSVEIVAPFVHLPNRTGTVKVTSVVGFLGDVDVKNIQYNKNEVESVFAADISTLLRTTELENFRDAGLIIPSWNFQGNKIWGLTGYILGEFLQVAKNIGIQ